MDRPTAARGDLAILLAMAAMALALMHPGLLGLALVIGVVSMLITPSPP
jgi:hypothetical protein